MCILFFAQAGKEMVNATNKLTTIFLKYQCFQPKCSFKKSSYKKKIVYLYLLPKQSRKTGCPYKRKNIKDNF